MEHETITAIRAQHKTAVAKVVRLRSQLAAAESDASDYETALRVLERHLPTSDEGEANSPSLPQAGDADGMTMPDLILLALDDGPKPIAAVTATVADLADKEIDANNIRSTAWRMWKANRIGKTGEEYHLLGQQPEQAQAEFEVEENA